MGVVRCLQGLARWNRASRKRGFWCGVAWEGGRICGRLPPHPQRWPCEQRASIQVLGGGGSSPVFGGGRGVSINCRQPTSESTSLSNLFWSFSTTPDRRVVPWVPRVSQRRTSSVSLAGQYMYHTASLMALSLVPDPCPAFAASRLPLEPNLSM